MDYEYLCNGSCPDPKKNRFLKILIINIKLFDYEQKVLYSFGCIADSGYC